MGLQHNHCNLGLQSFNCVTFVKVLDFVRFCQGTSCRGQQSSGLRPRSSELFPIFLLLYQVSNLGCNNASCHLRPQVDLGYHTDVAPLGLGLLGYVVCL